MQSGQGASSLQGRPPSPTPWRPQLLACPSQQLLTTAAAREGCLPSEVQVTFTPPRPGLFVCRFRFSVTHGEGVDIVLTGVGTHEEVN